MAFRSSEGVLLLIVATAMFAARREATWLFYSMLVTSPMCRWRGSRLTIRARSGLTTIVTTLAVSHNPVQHR